VNMINIKGKTKVFKGRVGKRNGLRKAIVRLAPGQEIDFVGAE
ncbi:MAG: 50S ribosomal protein L23, partial [Hydrogenovibrio crunogenus]|nr:50S ribosomal protein L23 [Hydrogenovibrio crunogenus]